VKPPPLPIFRDVDWQVLPPGSAIEQMIQNEVELSLDDNLSRSNAIRHDAEVIPQTVKRLLEVKDAFLDRSDTRFNAAVNQAVQARLHLCKTAINTFEMLSDSLVNPLKKMFEC